MYFKQLDRIASSTTPYKIALVLAVFILLFIASINYMQIKNLQTSADWVSHSLMVDKEINTLFSQYSLMESAEFRSVILRDSTFTDSYIDYKLKSDKSLEKLHELTKNIPDYRVDLDSVTTLKEDLHIIITAIKGKIGLSESDSTILSSVDKTAEIIKKLQGVKTRMVLKKETLLQERLSTYERHTNLTPLTSLLLALFSLCVFAVAFMKIRRDKFRIASSEAILQNIVRTTDNIMNYYEPILDDKQEVVDFKIVFANECNRDYMGLEPEKIIGKPISKVFPFLLLNGELEEMIDGYKKGEEVEFERQVILGGEKLWFHSFIKPMNKGILVVIRNKTEENKAHQKVFALNEQLQLQNTIFKDAESIASIGSYTWYLDNGEAIISDNFYRILGHEPDSFAVTYDRYREFVHPDDRENYDTLGEETMRDGKSSVDYYRVITKKGEIKHLQVNGQAVQKDGRPTSVGVVQDITERIKKDKKLQARNLELSRINEELESFNRVASHDLQEPLRKIQMFLSRIEDSEGNTLSKKGLDYFGKVNNAASRMQSLINNLLSYSRIDSTHEDFENVDLKLVLEKILDDRAEQIEETKAKIVSEKLPNVQGVLFQLEQLFGNLISNALKYGNPELPPKIILKTEKVHHKQIPENFIKLFKHYNKITIADNGIGFANENALKIFEVFQRLHQKNEYSGTGIGLAICKKIVENHRGFIYAISEQGKGSAFVIYLPA